jgi:hypothetical protein
MKRKSSVSTELANMADREMLGFIICYITTNRELQQSVRARMTEMMMLERCGVNSSSEGVVCGRLRRMRGNKTDRVQ